MESRNWVFLSLFSAGRPPSRWDDKEKKKDEKKKTEIPSSAWEEEDKYNTGELSKIKERG